MVKRFCDTDIWKKDWFLELPDKLKLLTKYIYDNCDCAGIYEIPWKIINVCFETPVTREDFQKIKQVQFISENTIFVEDFVNFQCGVSSIKELNPKNNAHKGVLRRLNKYNILEAPKEPLVSPKGGVQEKEKEINNTNNITNNTITNNIDIYCNKNFEECFKTYSEICKNLIPLNFERRNRKTLEALGEFLIEINYNFDYFRELCQKANKLKKIVDTKIDFKTMVNNHIGIMSDKYTKSEHKYTY